ncbi:hypothetical protein MVEN_01103000 [Mycena venus]|uniref:CCHC-type domain-containing protein n=1 Tax=Mycena venus TaxID=2733690 RepID=A0A8H6Y988_9AGAR|nr:hypothetical protein MVEN_01103000 [Mycena venus]
MFLFRKTRKTTSRMHSSQITYKRDAQDKTTATAISDSLYLAAMGLCISILCCCPSESSSSSPSDYAERSEAVPSRSQAGPSRGSRAGDICYTCRELGHWTISCPNNPAAARRKAESVECWTCGKRGHYSPGQWSELLHM